MGRPLKLGKKAVKKRENQAVVNARVTKHNESKRFVPGLVDAIAKSKRYKTIASKLSLQEWGYKHFPHQFYCDISEAHEEFISTLEDTIKRGGNYAFCFPRGSGKSTWLQVGILFAIANGYRKYIACICANAEEAKKFLNDIKTLIESSDEFAKTYPEISLPIQALDGIAQRGKTLINDDKSSMQFKYTERQLSMPNVTGSKSAGHMIEVRGINGTIRGLKCNLPNGKSIRPDLVVIDDPQTDDDAKSEKIVEEYLSKIRTTITGLAGPKVKLAMFCSGTIIQSDDVMEQLTDRSKFPKWMGKRVKFLLSEPINKELWNQYYDIRTECFNAGDREYHKATEFYKLHRAEMDAGASVYWQDRYDPDEISAIQHIMNYKQDNGDESFNSEMQNAPIKASTQFFNLNRDIIISKFNGNPILKLPDYETVITASIDINKHGLTWAVLSHSINFISTVLCCGIQPISESFDIQNYNEAEEIKLIHALNSLFDYMKNLQLIDVKGNQKRINRVSIDYNGQPANSIKNYVMQNQVNYPFELFASKGYDNIQYSPKLKSIKSENCHIMEGNLIYINSDYWKENTINSFILPLNAPSSITINANKSEASSHRELINQLTAEQLIDKHIDVKSGKIKYEWVVNGHNDLLDVIGYARALASTLGCSVINNQTLTSINAESYIPQNNQAPISPASNNDSDYGISYDSNW